MSRGRVLTTSDVPAPLAGVAYQDGVEGNSRLTGITGLTLFLIIAVEGVTLLQIKQLISVHVFVGMLLVPLILLKTATTGYRFTRYYTGDPVYTGRGAPHAILRITGPLVVLSSLALLGTGIALIALGRTAGHQYLVFHQVTFFVWIALMAVHVLGHARETLTLAGADWKERDYRGEADHRVAGARARLSLLVATVAVGLILGVASLSWVGTWHHLGHIGGG